MVEIFLPELALSCTCEMSLKKRTKRKNVTTSKCNKPKNEIIHIPVHSPLPQIHTYYHIFCYFYSSLFFLLHNNTNRKTCLCGLAWRGVWFVLPQHAHQHPPAVCSITWVSGRRLVASTSAAANSIMIPAGTGPRRTVGDECGQVRKKPKFTLMTEIKMLEDSCATVYR